MKLTAKQEIAKSIQLTKNLQVVQKSIATLERKIFLAFCGKGGDITTMERELIAKQDVEVKLIEALILL